MQLIKGKRSVMEALMASAKIDRILVRQSETGKKELMEVLAEAYDRGVRVQQVTPQEFDRIPKIEDSPHQGIVAYVDELAEHSPLKSSKVLQ